MKRLLIVLTVLLLPAMVWAFEPLHQIQLGDTGTSVMIDCADPVNAKFVVCQGYKNSPKPIINELPSQYPPAPYLVIKEKPVRWEVKDVYSDEVHYSCGWEPFAIETVPAVNELGIGQKTRIWLKRRVEVEK